jgi:hypothetical protein
MLGVYGAVSGSILRACRGHRGGGVRSRWSCHAPRPDEVLQSARTPQRGQNPAALRTQDPDGAVDFVPLNGWFEGRLLKASEAKGSQFGPGQVDSNHPRLGSEFRRTPTGVPCRATHVRAAIKLVPSRGDKVVLSRVHRSHARLWQGLVFRAESEPAVRTLTYCACGIGSIKVTVDSVVDRSSTSNGSPEWRQNGKGMDHRGAHCKIWFSQDTAGDQHHRRAGLRAERND